MIVLFSLLKSEIFGKRPVYGGCFFYFIREEVREMKKRIMIYFVDSVNLEKIYMKKKGFNYSHYDGNMLPERKEYSERISKGFRLFEMSRDGYPGD